MKSKSKNKTTQQGTQTQTSTGNTTAASQAYEQGIGQAFNTAAPEIGYSAAARHQRVDEGYDNPWSMNDSPEVREAQSYTRHSNIDQETGQLYKEDAARRREAKVGHQGALAGLLASNTTTGSSTGSGTFVGEQTQPWGPALIGAVGTAAGGFLG